MNKLRIFFLILISAFLFSENAYSCCRLLTGSQYSCNNVNWLLNDAANALIGCRAGNRIDCIQADKFIDQADVAVIQLLTECGRGNCLRGSLNPLEDYARRIANLSRDLQTWSDMRRTYDTTLTTVRSWQNTRQCGQTIQQRCQQYAKTAVSQNQLNITKACGYKGPRWTSNYAGHYKWCLRVSENDSHQETQGRKILLDNCAVAGACNRFIGSWKWFNKITVQISGDYRFSASDNTNGTWRCLPNGKIEMKWNNGWVDTLSMSSDGSSIRGKNQQGANVGGVRNKDCPGGYNPYGCN